MIFLVSLKDLSSIEGRDLASGPEAEVITRLGEVYDFLPKQTDISIKDGIVRIDIPEQVIANKLEATRLQEKASQRAKQGEYQKAAGIFSRVLELDPTNVKARRDLGMTYVELGEPEKAKEHLIEAATLDPNDAWSFVVLGNMLAKDENKWEAAERFYRKALDLKPDDGWALNSIGAMCTEHKYDEAVEWFDKSIAANPKFANPSYGRAHAFIGQGKPEVAIASIEELFQRAEMQDARSRPVFQAARENYEATAKSLAKINAERADRALEAYQEHVEDISGFPVKIERGTLAAMMAGQSQMAWKKQRDHHLIVMRSQYPEPLSQHIKAHELTHIALEAEARAVGRNKWFSTSAATRETAIRSMAADFKKFERAGLNNNKVAEVIAELVGGACGFLFNAPLDMLIERRIRERLPDLRYAQYCSLLQLARESEYATTHKEIRELSPRRVIQINDALNGAMALWLRDFTGGIADFTGSYRKLDAFALGEKLHSHFQSRTKDALEPGDEYTLVDEFADMLKMRDWYQWIDDEGANKSTPPVKERDDAAPETGPQGTTNPELLRSLDMASTMYLLAALQRFEKLPVRKVKEVALEIAVMGMGGLDYASSEKKYRLYALPGESFSGLELMCLMHAGLRQVQPDADTGMDLDKPFEAAKQLHLAGKGKAASSAGISLPREHEDVTIGYLIPPSGDRA